MTVAEAPSQVANTSGDPCPENCGGRLIVRTSDKVGELQRQYLECNQCGADGGKAFVPANRVHRRRLYDTKSGH